MKFVGETMNFYTRTTKKTPFLHRIAPMVLLMLLSISTEALDLTAQMGYEGEYTTNTARSENNEVDEWIHRPLINAGLTHQTNSLQASANYSARREIHSEDVFDDRTFITGGASITWQALPQRLSFNAFNTRTETSINSAAPDNQDNRQVSDTTGAGVSLNVPSFGAQYLQLDATFSRLDRDETGSDSDRQSSNLAYVLPFNNVQSMRVNLGYSDIDFDNEFAPDFISKNGNLQYVSTGSKLDIDVAAGFTRLERSLGRDDVDGGTGNASIVWRATGTTSLSASFRRSINDNSLDTNRGLPSFGEQFTEDSALNEVFTQNNTELTFNTRLGHNEISLSGYLRDKDYEDIPRDELRKYVSFKVSRNLRPDIQGRVSVSGLKVDFDESSSDYEELRAMISFDWKQIRNLTITTSAGYTDRTADGSTPEYDEVRASIRFLYLLAGK